MHTKPLILYLQKRGIGSSRADYQLLTRENATPLERSRCLQDIFLARDQSSHPQDFVRNLYLALLDSYENDVGLANHCYLAVHCLRKQVLHTQGIDPLEYDKNQKDLPVIIKKLGAVLISGRDALALRQNLGLEIKVVSESIESVGQICEEWLLKSSSRSLANLVRAVLCVPRLGRLVSKLLPLCFCNTKNIYIFVRSLQQHWQRFALYLGYS